MSKSQETGKKWPLTLILCGPVIAMVIACLASPFSPLKILLRISLAVFSIIYIIIIVVVFKAILDSRPLNVSNSLKSHPNFFPLFMFLTALGFTFLLSDLLYKFLCKFLCMSSISELLHELLQLYPMLFTGAITSTSIMFAVTYWVANRAENIVKLIGTIQNIKILAMITYVAALLSVFGPLYIIPSPSNSTSTLILYGISFLLSYPFGLTAGMILTSIMLDVLAVALRHELSEK